MLNGSPMKHTDRGNDKILPTQVVPDRCEPVTNIGFLFAISFILYVNKLFSDTCRLYSNSVSILTKQTR
jgi:hypothetical protein